MDWTPLRRRFRDAPLHPPPAPWRRVPVQQVGGLTDVGFGSRPAASDLLLVASSAGRGVFDCVSGERVARDHEDVHPDDPLVRGGIGPLAGVGVPMAGLWGGGLHTTTADGWAVHLVAPDWPVESVLLSQDDEPYQGSRWWHIHREEGCELRAFGFSPSGRTLVIASACDLILFSRQG
ncbi:hypothetical protein [Nonomuraea africana]|uniref:hypothetical protein n=1 Tax=Nonomuraea africana TaxID=46171 RepID=UPI0033ED24AB